MAETETSPNSPGQNQSLRDIAVETLRGVCLDKEAPAAAKAQSARTILELMGELGRGGDARGEVETRDLASLSVSELDREIARLSRDQALVELLPGSGASPSRRETRGDKAKKNKGL